MFAVRSEFAFRASGGMLSGPEVLAVFKNHSIVSGCKGDKQNTSYKTIEGCR
jgi:hypothetical protein